MGWWAGTLANQADAFAELSGRSGRAGRHPYKPDVSTGVGDKRIKIS